MSFGWPATPADPAPCKYGLVIHFDGAPTPRGVATMPHEKCRDYWKWCRRFHMTDRGWLDIGYSWGVCGHGVVFEGRGWGRAQAAQPGGNTTWTSVTLMLGDGEDPTPAQIEAVRELRAWLRGKGMAAAVRGHRDFVSTTCPGGRLYALVKDGTFARPPAAPGEPSLPSFARLLKVADPLIRGADVKWVQQRVNAHVFGAELAIDGVYGPRTAAEVRVFQRNKRLVVDGAVGKFTWKALAADVVA